MPPTRNETSTLAHSIIDMGPFPSSQCIAADDIVVLGLFGKLRGLKNGHIPQTVGLSVTATPDLLLGLYREYEASKANIQSDSYKEVLKASQEIVDRVSGLLDDHIISDTGPLLQYGDFCNEQEGN
jgi:hypothetical protein